MLSYMIIDVSIWLHYSMFLLALRKHSAMLWMAHGEGQMTSNYWCPLGHEENLPPAPSQRPRASFTQNQENEIWEQPEWGGSSHSSSTFRGAADLLW